jgi:hypothetical protein
MRKRVFGHGPKKRTAVLAIIMLLNIDQKLDFGLALVALHKYLFMSLNSLCNQEKSCI